MGQQHVVDDFPELVNAELDQGLVAAELYDPERRLGVAESAAGMAVAVGSGWPATGPSLTPKVT
jgi:hypothetical protein